VEVTEDSSTNLALYPQTHHKGSSPVPSLKDHYREQEPKIHRGLTRGGGKEQLSIPWLHRSLLLKSHYKTSEGKSTPLGLYSENICKPMDQEYGKY